MKVHNPNKLPTASMTELQASQGDLKFLSDENYAKLKGNIEKNGFDVPVYVWVDDEGTKWLLDGHARRQVLTTEGWLEPIPYLIIKAKDRKQAMQRLLEITSQYNTITQEGIDEFIKTFELPEFEVFEATSFDAMPLMEIGTELRDLEDKGEERQTPGTSLKNEELRDSLSISLTFDKASFVEFMTYANYFKELYGTDNLTDAIVTAVKEQYEEAIR
jgi:hypothetical protein